MKTEERKLIEHKMVIKFENALDRVLKFLYYGLGDPQVSQQIERLRTIIKDLDPIQKLTSKKKA